MTTIVRVTVTKPGMVRRFKWRKPWTFRPDDVELVAFVQSASADLVEYIPPVPLLLDDGSRWHGFSLQNHVSRASVEVPVRA